MDCIFASKSPRSLKDKTMRILVPLLTALLLLTSCADRFSIAGDSTIAGSDGRMLYLRISTDGTTLSDLDSCEVVHGRFSFVGDIDSVMLAHLFLGQENVMPLVLESGNLSIEMGHVMRNVSGGPLNESLYSFYKKKERLDNQLWDVERECMRRLHAGETPEEVGRYYSKRTMELSHKLEKLETDFIMANYENPLGPGYFMLLCNQFPSPIVTEQIGYILNHAPDIFLANPFVSSYVIRARWRQVEDKLDFFNED